MLSPSTGLVPPGLFLGGGHRAHSTRAVVARVGADEWWLDIRRAFAGDAWTPPLSGDLLAVAAVVAVFALLLKGEKGLFLIFHVISYYVRYFFVAVKDICANLHATFPVTTYSSQSSGRQ